MNPSALLLLVFLLISAATTSAFGFGPPPPPFNITYLLSRFPGFEQLNQLLSRYHLAEEINRRSTVTLLALSNGPISGIANLPEDNQRNILSLHVVLDYYDQIKLSKMMPATKVPAVTLYQSSGFAQDKQGFVDVIRRRDGSIAFASSVVGSPINTNLISQIAAKPYSICVLSVSAPIIAPGMDGSWVEPSTPPPPPPPAPAPPAPAPAPAPSSKKKAANATAPASAPAPASTPSPSDEEPAADEEEEEEEEAPADQMADEKSAAAKEAVSGGVIVTAALVFLLGRH